VGAEKGRAKEFKHTAKRPGSSSAQMFWCAGWAQAQYACIHCQQRQQQQQQYGWWHVSLRM
jgi:hypothetical protein